MIYSQEKKQYDAEMEKAHREAYLSFSPNEMKARIKHYKSERSIKEALLVGSHLVSEPAKIAGIRKALEEITQEDNKWILDLFRSLIN